MFIHTKLNKMRKNINTVELLRPFDVDILKNNEATFRRYKKTGAHI